MLSSRSSKISLFIWLFLFMPILSYSKEPTTVFATTIQGNAAWNNGIVPIRVYELTLWYDSIVIPPETNGKPMAIDAFVGGDTVVTANTNLGKFTKFPLGSTHAEYFTSPCGSLPQDVRIWQDPQGRTRILISAAGIDSLQLFQSNGFWLDDVYPGEYPVGMHVGIHHSGLEVVFAACRDSRTVAVVDLLTFEVIDTYDQVGLRPLDVLSLINPNSDTLVYVINDDGLAMPGTVHVLDLNGTPLDTIVVGSGPVDISTDPNAEYVYIANSRSGTVSCIATTTNEVTRTINLNRATTPLPATPMGVATNPFQRDFGFITNSNYDEVVRFTIPGHQIDGIVHDLIQASEGPVGIVVTSSVPHL